jgi:hypothetical protein
MQRMFLVAFVAACSVGRWESVRAEHPATRAELAAWPVSVPDPALREAMVDAGFNAVQRAPYKGELALSYSGGVGTLTSDGFFVDEVRGDPAAVAQALAVSRRVVEFVRNSGTVQQRDLPMG